VLHAECTRWLGRRARLRPTAAEAQQLSEMLAANGEGGSVGVGVGWRKGSERACGGRTRLEETGCVVWLLRGAACYVVSGGTLFAAGPGAAAGEQTR
jgi:hypothetical protein